MTLKDGEEYSGNKRGAIGESFSIKDLKLAAKRAGITVNDFIMAILSVSLQKYFVSKGKPEQEITLNLPGSFKRNADSAKSLVLNNTVSPIFYKLAITSDFEEALASVRAESNKLRHSFRPFGYYYLTTTLGRLPQVIFQHF